MEENNETVFQANLPASGLFQTDKLGILCTCEIALVILEIILESVLEVSTSGVVYFNDKFSYMARCNGIQRTPILYIFLFALILLSIPGNRLSQEQCCHPDVTLVYQQPGCYSNKSD